MADSVVAIELTSVGTSTDLVLRHASFSAEADRDEHFKGWTACLARIDDTTTAA